MKLAMVLERFDPDGGGAERSSLQIARELVQRGHDLTIYAGKAADSAQDALPDATISASPHGSPRSAVGLKRFSDWARRELDQGRFDTSLSITMAVPAGVVQPRGGTIRETLDRNIAMRPTPLSKALKKLAIRLSPKQQALLALERRTVLSPNVRKFAAVSGYVAQQFENHYGVSSDRVEVIPNAAEMPKLTDDQRLLARKQIREGLGIADDATMYFFAAMNPRLKGADTLLGAAQLLQDSRLPVVIVMTGELGHAYHEKAERMGVREVVRILPATKKMAEMYVAADVTVLPTFYDPSSKVVIESLMLGTPAISTSYNGASDFIDSSQGLRGRVIDDPADAGALAAAMTELADPGERAACRSRSVGLAEELSMKRHVDRLEALLASTAGASEPKPEPALSRD